MHLLEDVALAPYTTLGIGGPARWFARIESEAEVAEAVAFARARSLPWFVLGGGSNLLVSDNGFPGVVLHMALRGLEMLNPLDGQVFVQASAGENWDALVQFTVDRGLAGMECLAGIPGTVGGTPVQNVGAYGQEVSEIIKSVRCYDTQSQAMVELSNAACGFAYRTSVLNGSARGRYIVTAVTFALRPGGAPNLSYADLRKHFGPDQTPLLSEVAEAVRTIRHGKSMVVDPADPNTRSAGSFFRNPIVQQDALLRISEASGVTVEQVPHWPAGNGMVKLPAAWLLERSGFMRGYVMGKAGISMRHTLALINRGGASATDVVALRERIVATVEGKFGVRLEQEPVNVD